MPKFITIGYGEPADYDRTPLPVRDAAHAQDAKLLSEGAVIGIAGAPVQVRNPEARGVETQQGPFMSSAKPIAGFAIIEAETWPRPSKRFRGLRALLHMALLKSGR